MENLQNIVIDREFRDLIPPLTQEEYEGLEESIRKDGCRDALVLWGDTLIDGHNRYAICTEYGIPFTTVRMDFETRNDAIVWIIRNQFGRRNLPAYERARLALRLKPVIAEKAKEQQGMRTDICQKSDKCSIDTKKELATIAGVSHDTIAKVEKIEAQAPVQIRDASRAGDISVDMAYNVLKMDELNMEEIADRIENGEAPKQVILEVKARPHVVNNSGNNEWYTPVEFIEAAREVLGVIDTDPASSDIANKKVNAETYYTAENNGLEKEWFGNVWMNPPYSMPLIEQFANKLTNEIDSGNAKQAIVLVNNATETSWFRTFANRAAAIVFPKSRIRYDLPNGEKMGTPLQGQAFLYFGDNAEKFLNVFCTFGWGCLVWKEE